MVGVIDGFRWSISGRRHPLSANKSIDVDDDSHRRAYQWDLVFRKTERTFADVI